MFSLCNHHKYCKVNKIFNRPSTKSMSKHFHYFPILPSNKQTKYKRPRVSKYTNGRVHFLMKIFSPSHINRNHPHSPWSRMKSNNSISKHSFMNVWICQVNEKQFFELLFIFHVSIHSLITLTLSPSALPAALRIEFHGLLLKCGAFYLISMAAFLCLSSLPCAMFQSNIINNKL